MFIAMGNVVTSQSELKEFLRVNQPKIYSIAHNRSITGFENSNNAWLYYIYCWAAIGMLIIFATIVYCVYGCYASLQRGKSAFSSRTLQLYRSLVNALVIDLGICVMMVVLPIGICGICIYSQLGWASSATLLAMSFASWYPCQLKLGVGESESFRVQAKIGLGLGKNGNLTSPSPDSVKGGPSPTDSVIFGRAHWARPSEIFELF
ncbi:serpentine type 7TM GPCR chemoreceptor sri domain-containing protein [Ditylenchus destructor]|nr:serpentine type 7TM GPCR chemoreceptor sri domain-containing protein [Ditylenchus destructor]